MRVRKSETAIEREASADGLVVSMSPINLPRRTKLNEQLREYFIAEMPGFNGVYDEEESQEVLDSVNRYIQVMEKGVRRFTFPSELEGVNIRLLPITERLQLRFLLVDEYHGNGEYEKYVDVSQFIINEYTTEGDVDALVQFLRDFIL